MTPRLATFADSALILEWRNDPVTIANSRSGKGVEPEMHTAWFAGQVTKNDIWPVIIDDIGIVWFRRNRSGIYETSVNMNPAYRGRGLSVSMLACAMKLHGGKVYSTEVKWGNVASVKMFERNGFVFVHPSDGFDTYVTGIPNA